MQSRPFPPDPHRKIISAAEKGRLVIFIGAGASRLCGSPDWKGFADRLVGALQQANILRYLEAEQLKSLGDPRRTLSVAKNLAERYGLEIDYDAILHPSHPQDDGIRLYQLLKQLQPVFVTTNYDKWLHYRATSTSSAAKSSVPSVADLYDRPQFYLPEHFAPEKLLVPGNVIHLHGAYIDPSSMIISLSDYIRHYANENVIRFLTDMFRDFTVLFLGYGLSELEILEQIVRTNKYVPDDSTEGPQHFVLYPSRSIDGEQTNFTRSFFKDECGIELIDYIIDEKGYGEIVDVLQYWSSRVKVQKSNIIELQFVIDKYLSEERQMERRKSAINLLHQNKKLIPYFFSRVESPIWFSDLDAAGYFTPEELVGVVVDKETGEPNGYERAPGLHYLENLQGKVLEIPGTRIVEILRDLTEYSLKRNIHNWRAWWACVRIASHLDTQYLQVSDIAMFEVWLASDRNSDFLSMDLGQGLLANLLRSSHDEDILKAVALVAILTEVPLKRGSENRSDAAHFRDTLDGQMHDFGAKGGLPAVQLLMERLSSSIGTTSDDRFTYVQRRAVESHEQDAHNISIFSVLLDALRDACRGLIQRSLDEAKIAIKSLLLSKFVTLIRIGIYLVAEHYDSFSSVFWENVNEGWFTDEAYWHEIYQVIFYNYALFEDRHKQQFLGIVFALPGDWPDHPDVETWKDQHRRDLLNAAITSNDPTVRQLYDRLVQKVGNVRAHPEFSVYSSVSWSGSRSPLNTDEILRMSDQELIGYLQEFKPVENEWDGPSYAGLANNISEAVRLSEDGYRGRYHLFLQGHAAYAHGLLSGLEKRFNKDERDISWDELSHVISAILIDWPTHSGGQEPSQFEPNVNWLAGDIAALVKAGSTENAKFIPQNIRSNILSQLCGILERLTPKSAGERDDALTAAINTAYGRILESIIQLSVAIDRSGHLQEGPSIKSAPVFNDIRSVFDRALEQGANGKNLEFSALCGFYLPSLHNIAQSWVETNFNRIFSQECDDAWRCAASGFSYQNRVLEWFYASLRRDGHLHRMIFDKSLPNQVSRRALEFVGLAYVNGFEDIEEPEGILRAIVDKVDKDAISKLCWFFWTLRNSGQRNTIAVAVFKFWQSVELHSRLLENKEVLSSLNQLAVYIDVLDQPVEEMWLHAAPFAELGHHAHLLVSEMRRLANEFPRAVCRIFLCVIAKFLPTYEETEIREIVEILALAGFVNEAKSICIRYAENGLHLLDGVYQNIREM